MFSTESLLKGLILLLIYDTTIYCYDTKKVLLKQFAQCEDSDDLPILLSYFTVTQKTKGKYVLSGTFRVKEDMPDNWKLEVKVYKCKDSHTPESCEIYLDKLKNNDGCTILSQAFKDYASIFNDIQPMIKCPIMAGDYKLEDCSIDSTVINFLSYASSGSIKIQIAGNKNNKTLFCIDVRLDITRRKLDPVKVRPVDD